MGYRRFLWEILKQNDHQSHISVLNALRHSMGASRNGTQGAENESFQTYVHSQSQPQLEHKWKATMSPSWSSSWPFSFEASYPFNSCWAGHVARLCHLTLFAPLGSHLQPLGSLQLAAAFSLQVMPGVLEKYGAPPAAGSIPELLLGWVRAVPFCHSSPHGVCFTIFEACSCVGKPLPKGFSLLLAEAIQKDRNIHVSLHPNRVFWFDVKTRISPCFLVASTSSTAQGGLVVESAEQKHWWIDELTNRPTDELTNWLTKWLID